jgi:hypothetical protein
MKISTIVTKLSVTLFLFLVAIMMFASTNAFAVDSGCDETTGKNAEGTPCIQATASAIGFRIPTFSEILTFAIRAVFVFGGLAALLFLLLGAFAWITSGGEKDKVAEAQKKIQAAVLGVIMIAVVLAIVVTLEQVIFGGKICLGLSCPITIPSLVK